MENTTPDNSNKMITVAIRGFFDDGHTFLDHTSTPIDFPCIEGWMPPEIIRAVTSMSPGETKTVRAEASDVYQERRSDRVITIERSKLPDTMLFETGSVVHLESADGQTYPARVLEQTDEQVTFDANHDAIGKALNFQITLLAANELR